ncbi:toprim domain-containing protein [Yoonia sp. I 8.24]|uniref:toprim domain-containing protein n=1 Tax=Yoonia sp. I 8.24 TaxID=1537229 RepID=UPI001EDF3E82|nr:toprim domain-containing protein [Yoonia sp. I 8.24]MCG3266262.1 toprim domain-containing protein [Yoonia sp. I 8.24]
MAEVTSADTLPRLPGHLIIAADSDTAGQQAARKLSIRADRLGWLISHLTPPPVRDWNDVIVQQRGLK